MLCFDFDMAFYIMSDSVFRLLFTLSVLLSFLLLLSLSCLDFQGIPGEPGKRGKMGRPVKFCLNILCR